jgi:hypothetical protein
MKIKRLLIINLFVLFTVTAIALIKNENKMEQRITFITLGVEDLTAFNRIL